MNAKTERFVMIIGLIVLVSLAAYALITGDTSRFNNTYLGR